MDRIVRNLLCGTAMATVGVFGVKYVKRKIKASENNLNRQSQYYDVLLDWIDNMQGYRRIDRSLLKSGYRKIAVYGKGTLGFLLYRELMNTDVTIEYFIDQTADEYSSNVDGIPVVKKEDIFQMEPVDAIIVTPIHVYENIKKDLKCFGVEKIPIISIKETVLEAE